MVHVELEIQRDIRYLSRSGLISQRKIEYGAHLPVETGAPWIAYWTAEIDRIMLKLCNRNIYKGINLPKLILL